MDVYLPGCPPRPEALFHAVFQLHAKMDQERIRDVRWYQKGEEEGIPVPALGPDLVDWRLEKHIAAAGRRKTSREGES